MGGGGGETHSREFCLEVVILLLDCDREGGSEGIVQHGGVLEDMMMED